LLHTDRRIVEELPRWIQQELPPPPLPSSFINEINRCTTLSYHLPMVNISMPFNSIDSMAKDVDESISIQSHVTGNGKAQLHQLPLLLTSHHPKHP
jgi:hypothetical protein